jgi:4-amino-4-deoxy-L-arabinose transferase-like glycosyltransferase
MKSASRLLAAAFLAAIAARLLFVFLPPLPRATKAIEPIGDSREYVALAKNLAAHRTFSRDTGPPLRPELFRTPGYPLLLALPFALFGQSLVWPLLLQLLLSVAAVWLTRKLALELGLEPRPAAFAALLVGLSPNLSFLSSKLISEPLFTLLLLVCLLLLNRYRLSRRTLDLIGTGISLGLLILVRPIATFFPLVVAAYVLYLVHRSSSIIPRSSVRVHHSSFALHPSSLIPPLILLASASAVVAPWAIRNGTKTGRYIISTASEHNIYLYDAATVLAAEKGITIPQARDSMLAEAQAKFGPIDTTDEATMWQKLASVARSRFLRRPGLAAPVWLFGVSADFLNPISVGPLLIHAGSSPAPGSANLLQSSLGLLAKGRFAEAFRTAWRVRVGGAPLFILVVLALATLFNLLLIWFGIASLFLRRTRGLLWLLLPILYFTLVTGTVGDARFRAPIEPLLCLFAAVALTRPPRAARDIPQDLPSN